MPLWFMCRFYRRVKLIWVMLWYSLDFGYYMVDDRMICLTEDYAM